MFNGIIRRISFFPLFFFVVVLGMESKFLHMLGKFSATKQHPQTFVDYETDSHYVAQDVLEFSISQPLNLLGFHHS